MLNRGNNRGQTFGANLGSKTLRRNAGEKAIDWLFREQLRVDPEWSIKLPTGLLGGPTAMPKQSRLSALKPVKTAKLRI
jgi:hypothetical protein